MNNPRQSPTEIVDQELAKLSPERTRTFKVIYSEYIQAYERMVMAEKLVYDTASNRYPAGEGPILGAVNTAISHTDLLRFIDAKEQLETELMEKFPNTDIPALIARVRVVSYAKIQPQTDLSAES